MSRITSAAVAALIASASFSGAALAADGEYYDGVSSRQAQTSETRTHSSRSYGYTGSVSAAAGANHTKDRSPDRGDYYEGIVRPN